MSEALVFRAGCHREWARSINQISSKKMRVRVCAVFSSKTKKARAFYVCSRSCKVKVKKRLIYNNRRDHIRSCRFTAYFAQTGRGHRVTQFS